MKTDPALILLFARLDEATSSDQLFNKLTTGGLMYTQASSEFCHAKPRATLNLLQNPHLRSGKSAALFHLTEILAHRAVDHSELL